MTNNTSGNEWRTTILKQRTTKKKSSSPCSSGKTDDTATDAKVGKEAKKKNQLVGIIAAAAAMTLTIIVAYIAYSSRTNHLPQKASTNNHTVIGRATTRKNDLADIAMQAMTPKDAFLAWFVRNGGVYHPIHITGSSNKETVNVTIDEFPTFGGWGLAVNIPSSSALLPVEGGECNSNSMTAADEDAKAEQCKMMESKEEEQLLIRHLDPLFTVPSSLIITVQLIIETYGKEVDSIHYLSSFIPTMNAILDRTFPHYQGMMSQGGGRMGLAEQDIIIAIYLMVEDCHHDHHHIHRHNSNTYKIEDSFWGDYLNILPKYIIPRLDTFTTSEYEVLNDTLLERTGRESKHILEKIFTNDNNEYDTSSSNGGEVPPILQTLVRDMIHRKLGITTTNTATIPETCISFDTFHRFVGIVSSRAMVLKGVK